MPLITQIPKRNTFIKFPQNFLTTAFRPIALIDLSFSGDLIKIAPSFPLKLGVDYSSTWRYADLVELMRLFFLLDRFIITPLYRLVTGRIYGNFMKVHLTSAGGVVFKCIGGLLNLIEICFWHMLVRSTMLCLPRRVKIIFILYSSISLSILFLSSIYISIHIHYLFNTIYLLICLNVTF